MTGMGDLWQVLARELQINLCIYIDEFINVVMFIYIDEFINVVMLFSFLSSGGRDWYGRPLAGARARATWVGRRAVRNLRRCRRTCHHARHPRYRVTHLYVCMYMSIFLSSYV